MKQLTIFTPTYNRAYTLPRLYKSLLGQDTKLFKWLIVDDGSTDETHGLVKGWQAENKVDIRYIYQENAGKMQAHNRGVKECDTELFLCCDSDDWMLPESIRPLLDYWNENKRKGLCGIIGPRYIPRNKIDSLSTLPPKKYNTIAGLYKNGYFGETAIGFLTEVLRKYPFPIIQGEKFITEDYIYCQIDDKYQILVYPTYCMECEYQNDGYTNNLHDIKAQNPKGYALYYNEKARHVDDSATRDSLIWQYVYYARRSNYSPVKILKDASFPRQTLKTLFSVYIHGLYRRLLRR